MLALESSSPIPVDSSDVFLGANRVGSRRDDAKVTIASSRRSADGIFSVVDAETGELVSQAEAELAES